MLSAVICGLPICLPLALAFACRSAQGFSSWQIPPDVSLVYGPAAARWEAGGFLRDELKAARSQYARIEFPK